MTVDLTAIRNEYERAGLHERELDPSPFRQLEKWLDEAVRAEHPEPTAMVLATAIATPNGAEPSARVVLLRGV